MKRRSSRNRGHHPPNDTKKSEKNKLFTCEKCERKFNRNSSLMRHIVAVHLGELKNISCHICKNKFSSLQEWSDHMSEVHPPSTQFATISSAFDDKVMEKRLLLNKNSIEDVFNEDTLVMIQKEFRHFRILHGAMHWSINFIALMQSAEGNDQLSYFKVKNISLIFVF
jgi:hypothetical protein